MINLTHPGEVYFFRYCLARRSTPYNTDSFVYFVVTRNTCISPGKTSLTYTY